MTWVTGWLMKCDKWNIISVDDNDRNILSFPLKNKSNTQNNFLGTLVEMSFVSVYESTKKIVGR